MGPSTDSSTTGSAGRNRLMDDAAAALPAGLAPVRGLVGLFVGALAGVLFTLHGEWAIDGGMPPAILMNGEPLVSLHALAALGWTLAVLAPAWYWVGRPLLYRAADVSR